MTSIRPRDPRRRRSDLVSAISTREAGTERAEDRAGVPGPFAGRAGRVAAVAAAGAVAAGVLFHFVTRSHLWLDEALTVNIASQPLGDLHRLLRHDGAPPLYYVLLHLWTGWFGTGDLGARSLSGVLGLATLPLAYFAGLRLGGLDPDRRAWVGWGSVVVVATSPFAIRYSTEARMYMLEVFLVLAGYLALRRAMDAPSIGRLALVAVVVAALLYTQYWAVYLLAAVAAVLVWAALRRGGPEGSAAVRCLGALAVGGLAFVPWLPTFLYQARHTGTPWSLPYYPPTAAFYTFSGFAGEQNVEGYAAVLPLVLLVLLAAFGRSIDRTRIEVELRTRRETRPEAFVLAVTLTLGYVASYLSSSAFQSRYAAIVFPLFVVLVAYGTLSFGWRPVRYGALGLVVVFGLLGGVRNAGTQRTQAGDVVAAMRARGAAAGDVVAYCPDQLGPATSRLLPDGLAQYTFPTRSGPRFVDWVDYADRNGSDAADPQAFARFVDARAAGHAVWLVWSGGYRTYGTKCEAINGALGALRPRAEPLVYPDKDIYEPMALTVFRRP